MNILTGLKNIDIQNIINMTLMYVSKHTKVGLCSIIINLATDIESISETELLNNYIDDHYDDCDDPNPIKVLPLYVRTNDQWK